MFNYELRYRQSCGYTKDGWIDVLEVVSELITHVTKLFFGEPRSLYLGGSFFRGIPSFTTLTCDSGEALDFTKRNLGYWEKILQMTIEKSHFPLVPEVGYIDRHGAEGHVILLMLPLKEFGPGFLSSWYVQPNLWTLEPGSARIFDSENQAKRVLAGKEALEGRQRTLFEGLGW